MFIERSARFRRLGSRTYVHSTQIFSQFLELATGLGPAGTVASARLFKFIRETSRNGRCIIAPAGQIDVSAAASTIAFSAGDQGEMLFAFFDDADPAEGGGPELAPRIANVRQTGDFAGVVQLRDSGGPAQLFVDLIEANKALHNATLVKLPGQSTPAYRFVYAENVPTIGEGGRDIEVTFKANPGRKRGGHTYTLGEVTLSGQTSPAPIRICFAF